MAFHRKLDLLGVFINGLNNTGSLELENNYKLRGNNLSRLSTA